MSKYSEKIKKQAKTLYLKNQSLSQICEVLKAKFKKACSGLHRSTVDSWIKAGNWEAERAKIAQKAIKKAKTKQVKDISESLEDYHAESYEMDVQLRTKSHQKLKAFIENTPCELHTVRIFADIFRISTANIVKLWEIAKGKNNDDELLLDELLKLRGNKQ